MTDANLIPKPRRAARRRRRRIRAWAGICIAYAVVLGIGCGIYRSGWPVGGDVSDELQAVAAQAEQLNQAITELSNDMAQARLIRAAAQRVADQPDWSILLVLIDQTLGDDIVLNRCRLDQMDASGGAMALPVSNAGGAHRSLDEMPKAYTYALSGYGRDPESVAQFVLRLEGLGLFGRVTAMRTSRTSFLGGTAIAFEIVCTLEPRGVVGS
jgi:outer membrane murein-binding lipoprotein Lpp